MTKHKWANEISHKVNGGKVERRFFDAWVLMGDEAPLSMFDGACYEFRIYDPYREFKEARDRGEIVQINRAYVANPLWIDCQDRTFEAPPAFYRIKPREPREWWIAEYTDWGTSPHYTEVEKKEVETRLGPGVVAHWILVREVITP